MTRIAHIKNTEPCWVEYGFAVPIPDDIPDDEIESYAMEQLLDADKGKDVEVEYGPEVEGNIETLDQYFDLMYTEGKRGET